MSFTYEIPNINDPYISADWIEFFTVVTGNNMSKAEYQDFLESTQGYDADEYDLGIIDSVWQILEEREMFYGDNPPFNVDNTVIRSNVSDWKTIPYQLMCLIFSLEGNDHIIGYSSSASGTLFERVIKEATKSFFRGDAYIFGYPNESLEVFADGLTEIDFIKAMHPDYNDAGLDVLGTGPFNDNRNNDLSIIIQCAAGKNWTNKTDDINLAEWVTWLDFNVVPTKGFAVPIVMKRRDVYKRSKRMGLLIDRPRIYKSLLSKDFSSIQTEIENWCTTRLIQLTA